MWGLLETLGSEIASVPVETVPTEAYDSLKVQAILHEIDGKDHTGSKSVGVPAIFGMNFQAVSVAQKSATGGYTDAQGTPSPELLGALNFVDQSLGRFVQELRAQKQLSSTTMIITAKHGQTPIDRSKSLIVDDSIIPALVNAVAPKLLAQATEDDIALLWLNDQSKTGAVVKQLLANTAKAHIKDVLSGDQISDLSIDPRKDSRTPDIIVLPETGVIYAGPKATKIAEHGGFNTDDTHVALLASNPGIEAEYVSRPVATTQIAPTILQLLELNPRALQAVREEHTQLLPDIKLDEDAYSRPHTNGTGELVSPVPHFLVFFMLRRQLKKLNEPQTFWQEGVGSLLLLAAAKPPGLLEALVAAIMQVSDPTIPGVSPPNPAVVARLVLTLLFLPLAGLARTWDLRSSTGTMLAMLTGRERAYSQRYAERFLARLAHAGAAERLTEVRARWTWSLWQEDQSCAEQAASTEVFSIEGLSLAVYSDVLVPRGPVGKLGGKILGCRELVVLHDADGHHCWQPRSGVINS